MSKFTANLEANLVRATDCPECGAEPDTPCTENNVVIDALHASRFAQYLVETAPDIPESEEEQGLIDQDAAATVPLLLLTASQMMDLAAKNMRKTLIEPEVIEKLDSVVLLVKQLSKILSGVERSQVARHEVL